MVKNEKIITINRPVEEVFAYVSDLQNGPQWQNGLLEVRRTTKGPLGIGTQYTSVRKFMGRKLESGIEFVTYEPNKKIAFKSISGTSPFEQSFIFESTAEGTRLTTRLELQTSGLMGLAEPLIASGVRREMDANFGDLKDMLETRVAPVSA
jgi:uncharacterized membrane protein